MIYKPQKGQIKDGCMIYEKGTFFLFSMYHKENSDKFNNIWLATSQDGVHFKDYGCVVEDFPDLIWAMKVYRGEDAFYMNSGSFSKDDKQAVLKFWKSTDLYNWEYCPELDVESPESDKPQTRLDCMNVVKHNGHYYGYATGQYAFLTSDDGTHWKTNPTNINYAPFHTYNKALGGFEVADCIEFDGRFYMFCGGFGHLGMNGYGVYLYSSDSPNGPFKPCLPDYRINGTSKRWVNMWERCFEKDGEILAHNYTYDGFTYEKGNVYLPPIKKIEKKNDSLCLTWWSGNDIMYGRLFAEAECLTSDSHYCSVFEDTGDKCVFSEVITICDNAIIEFDITLEENSFTGYSCGGFYLAEDNESGSGVLFDTYGKCETVYVKNNKIHDVEDVISFGSTAPYDMQSGKTYHIRVLSKCGKFEVYVDDKYLQTFNNAHTPESTSTPFVAFGAISTRSECKLTNVKIYEMAE